MEEVEPRRAMRNLAMPFCYNWCDEDYLEEAEFHHHLRIRHKAAEVRSGHVVKRELTIICLELKPDICDPYPYCNACDTSFIKICPFKRHLRSYHFMTIPPNSILYKHNPTLTSDSCDLNHFCNVCDRHYTKNMFRCHLCSTHSVAAPFGKYHKWLEAKRARREGKVRSRRDRHGRRIHHQTKAASFTYSSSNSQLNPV